MTIVKLKDDKLGYIDIKSHEYKKLVTIKQMVVEIVANTLNKVVLEDGTIKMLDDEDFEIVGEIDE